MKHLGIVIVLGFAFMVFLQFLSGEWKLFEPETEKPSPPESNPLPEKQKPRQPIQIYDAGIPVIVSTFRNEVAGEQTYRETTYMQGFVGSVETDALGDGATVALSLNPGGFLIDGAPTIFCHVEKERLPPVASLQLGELIWMQGDHARRILGMVIFQNCRVVKTTGRVTRLFAPVQRPSRNDFDPEPAYQTNHP